MNIIQKMVGLVFVPTSITDSLMGIFCLTSAGKYTQRLDYTTEISFSEICASFINRLDKGKCNM